MLMMHIDTERFTSYKDPNKRTLYTNQILDGGKAPIFVVTAADDVDNPITSISSSGAW